MVPVIRSPVRIKDNEDNEEGNEDREGNEGNESPISLALIESKVHRCDGRSIDT